MKKGKLCYASYSVFSLSSPNDPNDIISDIKGAFLILSNGKPYKCGVLRNEKEEYLRQIANNNNQPKQFGRIIPKNILNAKCIVLKVLYNNKIYSCVSHHLFCPGRFCNPVSYSQMKFIKQKANVRHLQRQAVFGFES